MKKFEALLDKPKSIQQLKAVSDDRYLAEMTKCVFRAGFVWKIVESKWADFETVFGGFDTMSCAMLSDEALEEIGQDARIIRNSMKIRTVRDNAQFVQQVRQEHNRFSHWIADWPVTDMVGLWVALAKGGSRLGGNTCSYFLRFIGKDTFILSRDVVAALRREGVLEQKSVTSKRAHKQIQDGFNTWHKQSGRSMCEISKVLAYSVEN